MFVSLSNSPMVVVTSSRHSLSLPWRLKVTATLLLLLLLGKAHAEVSFEDDIQPILSVHCYDCHGPDKQKSKLRLDSPESILIGGDSGEPVFVVGDSANSHIIKLVTAAAPGEVMPPKGDRLSKEDVLKLQLWIDEGAPLPGIADANPPKIETDHWSFQPVKRPVPPFEGNEIDAFVQANLKEQGLTFSPQADKAMLIRRLYLIALGLPPTPDEVRTFLSDTSSEAYQKLVDSVLESPRYGERWARHWLDVVRYADSNGFETNRERKTAYHYRDYIINAFNDDKPYDQFIIEQIAGDAVGADVATGFLVAGPYDLVKSPDINLTLMQRQDELADMVNTTGTAFLGLTLGCARCHNHKFDPILQKDYYSMQAVFAGVTHGERAMNIPKDAEAAEKIAKLEAQQSPLEKELKKLRAIAQAKSATADVKPLRPAVTFQRNEESFSPSKAQFVRFTIKATSSAEPCIDELEIYDTSGKNVALTATPTASGTLKGYPIHKLVHINDGLLGNNHSWISDSPGRGWIKLAFSQPQTIERIVWARDRTGVVKDRLAMDYVIEASLDGKAWNVIASSTDREPFKGNSDPNAFVAKLNQAQAARANALIAKSNRLASEIKDLRDGPTAWLANFSKPPPTHRLYRGEPMQKREVVAPDALTVTGSLDMALDEAEQKRRLKLARWIASKDNPLTARVMVNRMWHYIFGTGIAETPSDLGVNGILPSNPKLLDWLADEFMTSDWSIKHMQRLILMSRTFQQSSQPREDAAKVDAGSKYLWRFPPRRLEAEAIRDSMLAVSGALDLTPGGPGFYLQRVQVENVMHYFPKEKFGPAEFRRMVYLFKIRQEQDAIFGSFDCPDGNQVIPKRSRSNTPLQALNLFNSAFVLQQADILATRLKEERSDTASRVEWAFELFFGRRADAFELETSSDMIESEGLQAFCRALYNTSEFLFVF
jgi:hypothetical protein